MLTYVCRMVFIVLPRSLICFLADELSAQMFVKDVRIYICIRNGQFTYTAAVTLHVPAAIMVLLADPMATYAKLACECFASVYPRVFLYVNQDRSPVSHHLWQIVTAIKERIQLTLDGGALGARIGAAKACQRLIQVQTRPDGDPRVCNV